MGWRLVVGLSLFGLVMAIGTVFWIPSNVEPILWILIFVICAVIIARQMSRGHFVHGLMVGIVNSVWVTVIHVLLFSHYVGNHPKEAAMMTSMPYPDSPRLMMGIVGPVIGVVSGAVIGLFAYVAGKFVRPRTVFAAAGTDHP